MKKNKKLIGIMILAVCCLVTLKTMRVKAEQDQIFTYGYTGTEQVFRVPYTGIYRFELYGAQGADAYENEGGKGGKVTATTVLNRGDEIIIYVGGQNGYNGGGSGTSSNGGGATDIRVNGREWTDRILVAGGGGGANKIYTGGKGGLEDQNNTVPGKGEDSPEGAGGGGGYIGGNAGKEHIIEHIHKGDTVNGGACYKKIYHKHSGNSSEKGGCYTKPVLHGEHVEDCYEHAPVITGYWRYAGVEAGSTVEGSLPAYVYVCDLCGMRKTSGGTGDEGPHCERGGERTNLICGLTPESVMSYALNCKMTEKTVVGHKLSCGTVYDEYEVTQASGGSNWYDAEKCGLGVSEAGVQTGDGMCRIELLSLHNIYFSGVESLNAYYNGIKVKRVYYKGNLVYLE